MSKKNKSKKGNKVDLSTFLGSHAEPGIGHLPRAPREQQDEPEYNQRGGRGGVFDRPMGFGGGGNEGEEMAPSAGDLADNWRRGPAQPSGGMGGMAPRGRGDDIGDGPPVSRGDEDGDWRAGMRPTRGDDSAAPVRAAEEDSNWRRGPKSIDGDAPPPPPRSDQDDDWRQTASDTRVDAPASAPLAPRGDLDSDWRKTASEVSKEVAGAPAIPAANLDSDWRKAKPVSADANDKKSDSREGGSWRDRTPAAAVSTDPSRPRLNLKPRKKEGEAAENDESTTAAQETAKPDDNGSKPKQRGDKWGSIFKKDTPPAPTGRRFGDHARDRERENAFSSRMKPKGPTREERERMFSVFGSRPRGEREQEQQQQAPHQRNQESFAAFGGQQRRDPARERMDRERAFAAFGGQREREPRDSGNQGREESGGGGYMGGMERLRARRQGAGNASGESDLPSKPTTLPSMKRTTNWGGDSDEEEQEAVRELSPEELETKSTSLVNAYFVMQDSREALKNVRSLSSPSYMPTLVKRIVDKGLESGVTKDLKLVAQLLSVLRKENLVSTEDVKSGLELVAEAVASAKDKDTTDRVLELVPLMEQKLVLEDVKLGEAAQQLMFPNNETNEADDKAVEKEIDQLFTSGKLGKDLAALAKGKKDILIPHASKILERVIADDEVIMDPLVAWASTAQYGALLHTLFYDESPDKEKLQQQIDALIVVQTRLNEKSFPKVKRGERSVSLIEEVFTKLYQYDVVPEEALQAWKEDERDTPGKLTVIVQTTAFFNFLDQSDESSGEEDSE